MRRKRRKEDATAKKNDDDAVCNAKESASEIGRNESESEKRKSVILTAKQSQQHAFFLQLDGGFDDDFFCSGLFLFPSLFLCLDFGFLESLSHLCLLRRRSSLERGSSFEDVDLGRFLSLDYVRKSCLENGRDLTGIDYSDLTLSFRGWQKKRWVFLFLSRFHFAAI